MRGFKKTAAFLLLLAAVLLMGACSKEPEGITTDFLEDTVFTVYDERISLGEWYLYALPQYDEIESLYGKDVWKYAVTEDGRTIEEMLKEDIKEQISYIKIVCHEAQRLGIAPDEDDMIDINIQTAEYMSRLSPEQISKYGITEELIRGIYTDNKLAMKVYEHLTLNIDTAIPEEKVRHMVLQYVMLLKTYEDKDGEFAEYSEDELAVMRENAQSFLTEALAKQAAEEIECLDEMIDERYSVVELVADYETLSEKFPGELPGIAFSLRQGEINGLYETDDAFFIFDCVQRTDEEATDAAKIAIIEERQRQLFEQVYSEWKAEAVIKTNYKVWDGLAR